MSEDFILPPSLEKGDKVAIVGTANGPSKDMFPEVYSLGLKRLKEIFELEPIEYPTATMDMAERTEKPEQRAKELMAAFKDDEIKGVIAPIGGSGESLRILKYLDPEVLRENPTRFYGYSDNTSINLYLWKHGIISFQGPMVMTELAMQGEMHEYTVKHCKKAFFNDSIGALKASEQFTDENLEWGEPENLEKYREMEENPGWDWYNTDNQIIEGRTWGGCLDVVSINLSADKPLPQKGQMDGKILVLESSEQIPREIELEDLMLGLGERGFLEKFSAIIMGRAKARNHLENKPKEEREEYREMQKKAIKKWMDFYAPDTPVIFNFDFGHTDPIIPLPIGAKVRINTGKRKIEFK